MGAKSSKLVITPENAEPVANVPSEVITQLKSNGENGIGDGIPSIDAVAESNGECQAAADTTAETIPATENIAEPKSQKKPNPINWIQKKISFKKTKTSKKSTTSEEKPVEPHTEEAPVVIVEETEESLPTGEVENVQIQSEEILKVDQETNVPAATEAEVTDEPVVEIAPTPEEVQNGVGEEQFIENDETKEEDEEIKENGNTDSHDQEPQEESNIDMGLAEKIANLGLDTTEPVANGNGIHINGDAIAPADES